MALGYYFGQHFLLEVMTYLSSACMVKQRGEKLDQIKILTFTYFI